MNLIDYASILARRGWIMLLLGIIAAGAAFFFSRGLDPVYRATQKVLIVPSRIDFGLTQAAKQTLNNHVAWLDSSLRAAEVIDLLQLDMSPTQLRADVRIAPNLDSQVIQIDAESKDPGQAERVAREWAQLLILYRNDQNQQARREDRIYASLQDNPVTVLARPKLSESTPRSALSPACSSAPSSSSCWSIWKAPSCAAAKMSSLMPACPCWPPCRLRINCNPAFWSFQCLDLPPSPVICKDNKHRLGWRA